MFLQVILQESQTIYPKVFQVFFLKNTTYIELCIRIFYFLHLCLSFFFYRFQLCLQSLNVLFLVVVCIQNRLVTVTCNSIRQGVKRRCSLDSIKTVVRLRPSKLMSASDRPSFNHVQKENDSAHSIVNSTKTQSRNDQCMCMHVNKSKYFKYFNCV